MEAGLSIFQKVLEKILERFSPTLFGIIGLIFLLFSFFVTDDLFIFAPLIFLLTSCLCFASPIACLIDFLANWVKKNYSEKQKYRKMQKLNKHYAVIIENLDKMQFHIIVQMLYDSHDIFQQEYDDYSEFQAMKAICLKLKRNEIGDYEVTGDSEYYCYTITFKVRSEVWEILMELYINNPELFER